PIAAIVKDAVAYGLNMGLVESRVLKSYGIENKIWKFDLLEQTFLLISPNQTIGRPKYINNNEMRLLGILKITLPKRPSLGCDLPVEFGLTFGTMEIKAAARIS
ncbi:22424_t:CDS:2, partial [Dentiscutata erythropus]